MRIEGLDTGRNKIMLLELCNIRDWAHSWAQHPYPRRFISKRPWHKHTCHGASYFWTPLPYAIYTQLGLHKGRRQKSVLPDSVVVYRDAQA